MQSARQVGIRTTLILLIVALIGFQQFPVIRIGGSFKVYELLAIALFLLAFYDGSIFRQKELYSLIFFVAAPMISFSFFWIGWRHNIHGYYDIYGNRGDFRYSYEAATAVPLLYFALCWISFTEISKSLWLYENKKRVIKSIVWMGHIVGWYAICASVLNGIFHVPTPVQILPSWLQNVGKMTYGLRASGFSQEPSFYVLYQGWVLLFTYHFRRYFGKALGRYLIAFSTICLLITFSSALVGFFIAALISSQWGKGMISRARSLFVLVLAAAICLMVVIYFGLGDVVQYAFVNKIGNFFAVPDTTLDSGEFRAYTAALGLEIFKDYPISGVGPGASIFFMHAYEYKIPIRVFGETLGPGSFPQNSYVSVMSDLGAVGFISMMLLFLYIFRIILKAKRIDPDISPFFTGTLFTMAALLSVAPAYSMFIWVFPALGVCFARRRIQIERSLQLLRNSK
ncbi:O-antigen ligase family protein [Solimonas marina]|uniref:O-antigen ligase family protein n=1 Tax=Solimonas marina TaxID=2714601 RepID=A0A969W993_9GAMM|nr:O-antigen ligase family protein [Solimonas marina]NKF21889.1 O-antigen ligase family protein [Solimonas marina]